MSHSTILRFRSPVQPEFGYISIPIVQVGHPPAKTLSRMKGFSLVELVIAISIFSIGLLGVASMVITVINGNRMSKNLTVAVNLAQDKMDTLRAASYADIINETETNLDENGSTGSGIFSRVTGIEASSTNPTYKSVAVTVSWTDLSPRQVVLKSIIAE